MAFFNHYHQWLLIFGLSVLTVGWAGGVWTSKVIAFFLWIPIGGLLLAAWNRQVFVAEIFATWIYGGLLTLCLVTVAEREIRSRNQKPLLKLILQWARQPATHRWARRIAAGSLVGIMAWLIWGHVRQWQGFLNFYMTFFPQPEPAKFMQEIGWYFIVEYILVISVIVIIYIMGKRSIWLPGILLILSLIVSSQLNTQWFNIQTLAFRDSCIIWTIKPNRVTLWEEVTITGRNFQENTGNNLIKVAGVPHRVLQWTKDKIVFQVEPGKSKSGEIEVVTASEQKCLPVNLEVYDYFTREVIK